MANEVVINVRANAESAKKGLAGIADKMKNVGRGMTIMGGAITGIGIASVATFAKMGDEVHKMALRTGFSTEALSGLRLAADLSGTSITALETGLKRMSKVIVDANDGLAESKDALDRMGISTDELIGKSPEKQFEILTMGLANMKDETMRMATAQEVFGRAGTQLLPMLEGGAEGFAKLTSRAAELGMEFDQVAAQSAADFTDSLTELKGSMGGIAISIGGVLAPLLTDLAEKMTDLVAKVTDWMKENEGLTQTLVIVASAIGGILLVLGPLLMMLPGIVAIAPAVGAAWGIMMGPIGWIVLAIAALAAGVVALKLAWDKNLGGIQEKTEFIFGKIKDLYTSKLGWILPGGALIKALLYLKENWTAIWEGMKEVVRTVFESVAKFVGEALDWIVTKVNKLIDGVNAVGGVFGQQIPHLDEIGDSILELGKKVKDAASEFLALGMESKKATDQMEQDRSRFNVASTMPTIWDTPSTSRWDRTPYDSGQGGAGTGFGGGGSGGGGGGMGGAGRFAPAMTPEQIAQYTIMANQLMFLTNPQAQIGALSHAQITGGLYKIGLGFTVDQFGQATIEYPAMTWQQMEEHNTN